MLDRSYIEGAIDEIVDGLAGNRFHLDLEPHRFEQSVLMVAETFNMGVTNVMGRVATQVSQSSRFSAEAADSILEFLRERGVGVAEPTLRCY